MTVSNNRRVAIYRTEADGYPAIAPFHPPVVFPEYPYGFEETDPSNLVYSGVREALHLLGFDSDRYETKEWNPLGELIKPGDKVLIKPNFIFERHGSGEDPFSVITHGSIIRAVIDYVVIALGGKGRITVADAPVVSASFEAILERTGLVSIMDFCSSAKGIDFEHFDMRTEAADCKGDLIMDRMRMSGDPRGYRRIDLGSQSEFHEISEHHEKYRGSDYDREETISHHNATVNEYLLSGSALDADVIIHLPKLKTHQKSGVTLNLKGIIGLNGDKNWIPHFRVGPPSENGDEFPGEGKLRVLRSRLEDSAKGKIFGGNKAALFLARLLRKPHKYFTKKIRKEIRSGAWYGNNTLWRSVLDLNKILLYADREGIMQDTPQRKLFSIIDGIVAGDKNGPMAPRPRKEGIIIAGANWLAVDISATRLMGFDFEKIPVLQRAINLDKYRLADFDLSEIDLKSNIENFEQILVEREERFLNFVPAPGWHEWLMSKKDVGKFAD